MGPAASHVQRHISCQYGLGALPLSLRSQLPQFSRRDQLPHGKVRLPPLRHVVPCTPKSAPRSVHVTSADSARMTVNPTSVASTTPRPYSHPSLSPST